MNNLLNMRRLGNYCLKQVNEWMRGLFLHFISIAGIYTILMLVFRFDSDGSQPYIVSGVSQFIIWLSFFVYIAKMSTNLSEQIGTRSRLVLYLAVPVSTLEKYVTHLLSVLVLYPFLFFAGIVVAQYASELFASLVWRHPFHPGIPLEGCFSFWSIDNGGPGMGVFWAVAFNVVALFTLGATIWKNNSFVKTIAAIVLFNIVMVFVWIATITQEEVVWTVMMADAGVIFENEREIIRFLTISSYIPVIVFAIIGYMRMKELEVNETKK